MPLVLAAQQLAPTTSHDRPFLLYEAWHKDIKIQHAIMATIELP